MQQTGRTTTQADSVAEKDQHRLRRTNIVLGLLHLAQGLAVLILGSGFKAEVTASFYGSSWSFFYEPRILLAAFLFLSAFAHLNIASPWGFPWYIKNLNRGMNPARWYEYSLSASVMIIVIASLTGIKDLVALMSLFFLTAAMNLFGLMMELHNENKPRTDWTAFFWGSVVGIIPWVAIALYFVKATPGPPAFVYGIFFSLLVLYTLFPLNMWLQYGKKGPWKSYIWGEYGYMILSLTAKSLLAWQVFGGTLNSPILYS